MTSEETGAMDEEMRCSSLGLASASGGLIPQNGAMLQPNVHLLGDQRILGGMQQSEDAPPLQIRAQPPSQTGSLPLFHGGQALLLSPPTAPSQSAPAPQHQSIAVKSAYDAE
uniref:Uncharacterized protein n=1 Tax=Anopheles merus TaxID=30066 RepID=A0A182UP15_ANOME